MLLTQDYNLLEESPPQGGRFHSSLRSKPVQNVVELDGVHQSLVNYDSNDLPKHLHNTDSTVLASTLGEKNNSGTHAIYSQLPRIKIQLDDFFKSATWNGGGFPPPMPL